MNYASEPGLGSLSIGAQHAGFKSVALVERQQNFCDLSMKLHEASVVCADIGHISTVGKIMTMSNASSSIGCGFSCQSYSRRGDRLGGLDSRSSTLPNCLWTAYMTDAKCVVLECVSDAPNFDSVQNALAQFREITGFAKSECILDYNTMWPNTPSGAGGVFSRHLR